MVTDTRRERSERLHSKHSTIPQKAFALFVFIVAFLLMIWVFIEAVRSQSGHSLVYIIGIILVALAYMFHHKFYKPTKDADNRLRQEMLFFGSLVAFLVLGYLLSVFGAGNISLAVALVALMVVLFIMAVGVGVFMLDLVFWEGT